jgi:hypothetical protein
MGIVDGREDHEDRGLREVGRVNGNGSGAFAVGITWIWYETGTS